jgi:hypothetical protein
MGRCVVHRTDKDRVAFVTKKGNTRRNTKAKPRNTVPRYRAASPTLQDKLRLAESERITTPSTTSRKPHTTSRGVHRRSSAWK